MRNSRSVEHMALKRPLMDLRGAVAAASRSCWRSSSVRLRRCLDTELVRFVDGFFLLLSSLSCSSSRRNRSFSCRNICSRESVSGLWAKETMKGGVLAGVCTTLDEVEEADPVRDHFGWPLSFACRLARSSAAAVSGMPLPLVLRYTVPEDDRPESEGVQLMLQEST